MTINLLLNGHKLGKIYNFDHNQIVIPKTNLCRKLNKNEYVVQGISSIYSYDSRYYGVISSDQIIGGAIKI